MDKVKRIPVYKRFGVKVLLFNAVLFVCLAIPVWDIRDGDYKDLMDRSSVQSGLFRHCRDRIQGLAPELWPDIVKALPQVLPGQRIMLFNSDGKLIYSSGVMTDQVIYGNQRLLLPHPYVPIPSRLNERPTDTENLVRALKLVPGVESRDYQRIHHDILNVQSREGMDRVIVRSTGIVSSDGTWSLLVMTSSVVDILMQNRAVKERFMLLFLIVLVLAVLLSLLLSRSVTRPFMSLYRYALHITEVPYKTEKAFLLPQQGEIGEICKALQKVMAEQQSLAENFRRFSGDVVHELKTPLSAVRSGLELLQECEPGHEQQAIADRIQKRLMQMDQLMDEIHQLGKLESAVGRESCVMPEEAAAELQTEYEAEKVGFSVSEDTRGLSVPLSKENLCKIVRNLVDNGISFSPEKGSVKVSLTRQEDWLLITVKDRGPGIAPEAMDHIHKRFYTYRPDSADRRQMGHTGLGLAIIHSILHSCGGRLTFYNSHHQKRATGSLPTGAVFECRIPVR